MYAKAKKRFLILRWFAVALGFVMQAQPVLSASVNADGDLQIVICTPDGAKSISWDGITDSDAPDKSDHEDCDQNCAGCCRTAPVVFALGSIPHHGWIDNETLEPLSRADVIDAHNAGPPLPSRAPPYFIL